MRRFVGNLALRSRHRVIRDVSRWLFWRLKRQSRTRYRLTFKSKYQLPWVMLTKEWLDEITPGLYAVTYAEVIWSIG